MHTCSRPCRAPGWGLWEADCAVFGSFAGLLGSECQGGGPGGPSSCPSGALEPNQPIRTVSGQAHLHQDLPWPWRPADCCDLGQDSCDPRQGWRPNNGGPANIPGSQSVPPRAGVWPGSSTPNSLVHLSMSYLTVLPTDTFATNRETSRNSLMQMRGGRAPRSLPAAHILFLTIIRMSVSIPKAG